MCDVGDKHAGPPAAESHVTRWQWHTPGLQQPAAPPHGRVSVFLSPGSGRWICESQMSMNSYIEILDLIRGGWVNGGGKGVALCVNYYPGAASSASFLPSYREAHVMISHFIFLRKCIIRLIWSFVLVLFLVFELLFKDINCLVLSWIWFMREGL